MSYNPHKTSNLEKKKVMNYKNLLIAGTRTYNNYEELKREVDYFRKDVINVRIITGCAKGADTLAKRYAREHDLPLVVYEADWKKHGKKAGPIRNKAMAYVAHAVVLFWDGKSKGTLNMYHTARMWGIETIRIVRY